MNEPHLHVVSDETAHDDSVRAAERAQRIAQNQVAPAVSGMAALGQTEEPAQPVGEPTTFMQSWLLHSALGVSAGGAVGAFAAGSARRLRGATIGASVQLGLLNLAGAAGRGGCYPATMGQRLFMGGAAVALLGIGGWLAFGE